MIIHIMEGGVTLAVDDERLAAQQVKAMLSAGQKIKWVKMGERESEMKPIRNIPLWLEKNR